MIRAIANQLHRGLPAVQHGAMVIFKRMLALATAATLLGTGTDPDAAFKAGAFDTANAGYAQEVSHDPANANALLGLATTELYNNDLAAAGRDLQRALKIDPSNPRAQRLAHILQIRSGKPGEFQITQTGDAVLPFVAEAPLPVVEMQINGIKSRVAIDTGAPVFVVTEQFAREHGLKVSEAGTGVFAGGRQAQIKETSLNAISVGPLAVRNVPANVMQGPGLSTPTGRIDGIIGTGFFSRFLTTIDYPRHRLILRPADAVPPKDNAAVVPMWLVGDHFIFAHGLVNDVDQSLFVIDTGADFAVHLTKASLEKAHITADGTPQSFLGGGGETKIIPFTTRSLAIGSARQRNTSGVYFPEGDPFASFPFEVAGAISGGFLKHYAVTFDFKTMHLMLAS